MNSVRDEKKSRPVTKGDSEEDINGEEELEMEGEEEWYYEEEQADAEGEEEQYEDQQDEDIQTLSIKEPILNIKSNLASNQAVAYGRANSKDQLSANESLIVKEPSSKIAHQSIASKQAPQKPSDSELGIKPNPQAKLQRSLPMKPALIDNNLPTTIQVGTVTRTHSRLPSRSEIVRITETFPQNTPEQANMKLIHQAGDTSRDQRLPVRLPGAYVKPIIIDNASLKPTDNKKVTPMSTMAMFKEVVATGTKSPHIAALPLRMTAVTPVHSINQSPRINSGRGAAPNTLGVSLPITAKPQTKMDREDSAFKPSQSNSSFTSIYHTPQKMLASSNNGSSQHLPSLPINSKHTVSRQGSFEDALADAFPSLKKADSFSKYPTSNKNSLKAIEPPNLTKPKLFFDPHSRINNQLTDSIASRRPSIHLKELDREKGVTDTPYVDLPSVSKAIGRSNNRDHIVIPNSRPTSRSNFRGAFMHPQQERVATQISEERRKNIGGNQSLNVSIGDSESTLKSPGKDKRIFQLTRKNSNEATHSQRNTKISTEAEISSRIDTPLLESAKQYINYCSKEIKLSVSEFEALNARGIELSAKLHKLSETLTSNIQNTSQLGKKNVDLPPTYTKSTMNYLIMRYSKDIETNKSMLANMDKELERTESILANIKRPG